MFPECGINYSGVLMLLKHGLVFFFHGTSAFTWAHICTSNSKLKLVVFFFTFSITNSYAFFIDTNNLIQVN